MKHWPADANILDPDIFPTEKGPPHALFDLWRRTDPVHWNPATPAYAPDMPNSAMTKGFWVLTRYQDVFDVSRDQEQFSSHAEGFVIWDLEEEELQRHRANFMGMTPADHAPVKRMLMPAFSPRSLKALAPDIERVARRIVDDVAGQDHCEFVFDVASRLPVYTFCELMGIPESMRERVVELGNAMADVETHGDHEVDPTLQLFALAEEVAQQKRRQPDDSLMSLMVHDQTLGLNPMNINMFFVVFAVAGHETTRSTAAHFIQLMNAYPEQYALLRSDVDKHLDNAIEEVLRFTSTTTNFRRTATCDTEIGGQAVKKGDKIYLSYAAANRDPAVFADPHVFDITRPNVRKHLAFGTGPHVCIGAGLARMQLQALLKQIVTRIPDLQVAGEPQWLRSIWFNAITRLPITFTPETA
ncbi:MAG: cytochrome P450 [Caulobacter sp.]|nr:cytochrome P450 [Caulobacter sp.]